MQRAILCLTFLLAVASFSAAQTCKRAANAGKCRGPSASSMLQLISARNSAFTQVLGDVVVQSPYDGRSQQGCGGGGCKINQAAAKQRAKTLAPAQAFAAVARDIPEWYLKSRGAGCTDNSLLDMYTSVLLRWAEKNGFLGKVSEQGVLEVDWKIVTVSAGYSKMKQYINAAARGKIESWISKLYDVTSKRDADANNNHLIWHINALVWADLALGRYDRAAKDVGLIVTHMNKYIDSQGIITTEGRCQKTLHYQHFYLEAALGAIAGYKYHTGNLPAGWAAVANRVSASLENIKNPKLGVQRAIKTFGYTGSLKSCQNINPAASDDVTRTIALYQTVVSPRGALAPCQADSSYFGNFRFMPFMWAGARNPPLGQVCC